MNDETKARYEAWKKKPLNRPSAEDAAMFFVRVQDPRLLRDPVQSRHPRRHRRRAAAARRAFARAGWRLAVGSLVLLAVLGLSPVGNALIVPLEQRFPPWDDRARAAGRHRRARRRAQSRCLARPATTVALNEAAERLTVVAELARRYPDARIIFSGGSGALLFGERPEAEFALRLLESFGVAPGRVILEDKSRNTVENALFSKRARAAEAGRALAAGDLRLSHAAFDRRFPQGRIPGRGLSGRLAHPRHRPTCCVRFRRWATGCGAPTPRCANGSGSWPIG